MLHSLTLPKYENVKSLDGTGNFAVDRYYKFPFSFFYRMKLRLILSMFEKGYIYRNILDFGCGKANILKPELSKRALNVVSIDQQDHLDPRSKFDVIICGSILEFVDLEPVCQSLRHYVHPTGMIIVSSPLQNLFTNLYFKAIGDRWKRHSHKEIVDCLSKYFFIVKYRTWLGLYFVLKGYPK